MIPQYLKLLKKQFNNKIDFYEKRPGIYQLIAPFFHEDGDMVEIYLQPSSNGHNAIKISDYGMTVMRLSYSYQLDTENKIKVFNSILAESQLAESGGIITLEVKPEHIYEGIMQFVQAITKVSSMRYFSREVVRSMFYELVEEYIISELTKYSPTKNVVPIQDRDDLEVDFQLKVPKRPIYMFAVKDVPKARLATICCLEFQRQKIPFRSVIVHEDFNTMPNKDRARITSAADKQFIDIDDFKKHILAFLEREAS